MKFVIEQLAFCPADPDRAIKLLTAMGATEWAKDLVLASGKVRCIRGHNEAALAFNYQMLKGPELEVLHYTDGPNWMERHGASVSHVGMHVTAEELAWWRGFFAEQNIAVAQEVITQSHTNPVIAGKRNYNYVIFDTRDILGVDVKFIVRINAQS